MSLANKVKEFNDEIVPLARQIVHGDKNTTVMTDGGPVRTFAKLIADNDAAINAGGLLGSVNESRDAAQNALAETETVRNAAQSAREGAEAARDAAQLSAGIFLTLAEGLAGTVSGKYFTVPAEGVTDSLILYRNNAGVALEATRYPTRKAVESLEAELVEAAYAVGYSSNLPIPAGSTAVTSGNFVFADPVQKSGRVQRVYVHALTPGNLTVKTFSRAADVFTELKSTVVPVTAGYQELLISLAVNSGEYLGFSGTGIVGYGGDVGAGADGSGWYSGPAGNTFTDATSSTSVRFGIRLDIASLGRINSISEEIARKADSAIVDAIERDMYTVSQRQVIGLSGVIPGGNAALSARTLWVLNTEVDIKGAPRGAMTAFACFASRAGNARVMTFSRDGSTFTVKREQSVALSQGYQSIPVSLPVEKGDYVGFQSDVIEQLTPGGDTVGWYGGPGVYFFTDSTLSTGPRLLVRFEIEYHERPRLLSRPVSVDLPFEHMLVIGTGQSLMEGSQTASSDTHPITTVQEFDSVSFPAYPAAPTTLYPATVANTQRPNSRGEWPGLACAASIRRALRRDNNLTENDIKSTVVVANNAVGGTPIANLSKGTGPYNAGIAQAAALAGVAQTSAGVLAVIYGQGESDGATARATYRDALVQLAKDYDADLRAATGQTKRVPLIGYQMSAGNRNILLAQLDAARICDLVKIACPMYQFNYYDNVHIDSVSSRRLGAYYGEAVKVLSIDGGEWEPLQPVAAQVIGNAITLTFNKTGLAFDTTLIPAQTNHGFFVATGALQAVAINAVEILNSNQVRITCATTPAAGWTIQYGVPAVGKGPYTGRAGNLRDSSGESKSFDGWPLHNYSVMFDWTL